MESRIRLIYLLGRKFTILSDHRPLEHLLSKKQGIPTIAWARIKQWALILAAYDYQIQYKRGQKHDVLSRLPLCEFPKPANIPPPGEMILLMDNLEMTPVNARQVKQWTDRNRILSKVRTKVWQGNRSSDDHPQMQPTSKEWTNLVFRMDVSWGDRVVIPQAGCENVLKILHEGRPGILRKKRIARGVVR